MYFDVCEIESGDLIRHADGRKALLLDGGLLANNPALIGLLEARDLSGNMPSTVLSIGTGIVRTRVQARTQWLLTTLRTTVSTSMSSEVEDATLNALLPDRYFRITSELNQVAEMDRYEYFDHWLYEGKRAAQQYARWPQLEKALGQ